MSALCCLMPESKSPVTRILLEKVEKQAAKAYPVLELP